VPDGIKGAEGTKPASCGLGQQVLPWPAVGLHLRVGPTEGCESPPALLNKEVTAIARYIGMHSEVAIDVAV
jgi:hypothetical protein